MTKLTRTKVSSKQHWTEDTSNASWSSDDGDENPHTSTSISKKSHLAVRCLSSSASWRRRPTGREGDGTGATTPTRRVIPPHDHQEKESVAAAKCSRDLSCCHGRRHRIVNVLKNDVRIAQLLRSLRTNKFVGTIHMEYHARYLKPPPSPPSSSSM
jgi:hypothetical protein